MRQILFLILSLLLFSCGETKITDDNFSNLIDQKYPPVITFTEETYDFGKLIEGAKIEHTYHFENTGRGVLVIGTVGASCGCTVPKNWPKKAIKPGEKGEITVVFNSEGRVGTILKDIRITGNTSPKVTYAYLKGTVIGPETKIE